MTGQRMYDYTYMQTKSFLHHRSMVVQNDVNCWTGYTNPNLEPYISFESLV